MFVEFVMFVHRQDICDKSLMRSLTIPTGLYAEFTYYLLSKAF